MLQRKVRGYRIRQGQDSTIRSALYPLLTLCRPDKFVQIRRKEEEESEG